ncbi:hypothetical protein FHG87_017828 [Trinorchestia longiramus]|nr:hypothetical protein FHG87_017828 [Trinorchestia longiramus]
MQSYFPLSRSALPIIAYLLLLTVVWLQQVESVPVPEQRGGLPQIHDPYEKRPPKLKKGGLSSLYKYFVPFYARPQYRYPYYDDEGNGELLYGYGGNRLYKYTVFQPVDGYSR